MEPGSQFCGECGWKVGEEDEPEANPVKPPVKEPLVSPTEQVVIQPQQREKNPFKSFSQAVNQGAHHQWKGDEPPSGMSASQQNRPPGSQAEHTAAPPSKPQGNGTNTGAGMHSSAKVPATPPPSHSPGRAAPHPSARNSQHLGASRQRPTVHTGNQAAVRGAPGSARKKPLGLLMGIVLLLVLLGVGVMFFLGRDNDEGPDTNSSPGLFPSGISPEALNGNWSSDFTPLSVTLNDEVVPEYNIMIGLTTSARMNLSINSAGKGSASFQGSSYGYEFSSDAEAIFQQNELTIRYQDPSTGYQLEYTGTVSQAGEGYMVRGTYETVMAESGVIPGELRVKGSWESYTVQARVGEELDTTGAKTDATLADLQGAWTGQLAFDDFVIRNAPPGSEAEVQEFQEEVIGRVSTCTLHFQDDTFFMTFLFPDGTEDIMDEFPPVALENGVFSVVSASSPNDRDHFRIDVYGVIKDTGGELFIDGGFTFEAAEGGSDFEMKASFQVSK